AGSDIDRTEAGSAIAPRATRRQQAAGHLRIGAALLPAAGRQRRSAAALGGRLADQPAVVVADWSAFARREVEGAVAEGAVTALAIGGQHALRQMGTAAALLPAAGRHAAGGGVGRALARGIVLPAHVVALSVAGIALTGIALT